MIPFTDVVVYTLTTLLGLALVLGGAVIFAVIARGVFGLFDGDLGWGLRQIIIGIVILPPYAWFTLNAPYILGFEEYWS